MKTTVKILFLLLFAFVFLPIQAQRVVFTYDTAGNRTTRGIERQPDFLRNAPSEDVMSDPFVEQTENRVIKIYPNPTRGMLIIEISSNENNERFRAAIYNMQGGLMQDIESFTGTALNMDLSAHPPAVYVLQLRIGDEVMEYKIIKQ